jgi:hypothetical protein
MATNPLTGWCNYSSPWAAVCGSAGRGRITKRQPLYCGFAGHGQDHYACRENESVIVNPEGLKMLLAFKRDGEYLAPGVLNLQNKLDGEGPFRVVPPQKNPVLPINARLQLTRPIQVHGLAV